MSSRTKRSLFGGATLFTTLFFYACSLEMLTLSNENKTSDQETASLSQTSIVGSAVNDDQVCNDSDYMTEMAIQCDAVEIPDMSGCESHGMCIDECVAEGSYSSCVQGCDEIYLGESYPEGRCGCETCLQECNEWCFCGEDEDTYVINP